MIIYERNENRGSFSSLSYMKWSIIGKFGASWTNLDKWIYEEISGSWYKQNDVNVFAIWSNRSVLLNIFLSISRHWHLLNILIKHGPLCLGWKYMQSFIMSIVEESEYKINNISAGERFQVQSPTFWRSLTATLCSNIHCWKSPRTSVNIII